MTEAKIMKDLERAVMYQTTDVRTYKGMPIEEFSKAVLDLIISKNAEIERLKADLLIAKGKLLEMQNLRFEYDNDVAEAIKEFAEMVKAEINQALESNYKARAERQNKETKYVGDIFWNYCTGKIHCLRGLNDYIDELKKEKGVEL